MFVELPFGDLFGRLHNESAARGIEQAKVVICLRRRPFNQTERANETSRKSIPTNWKIQERALRRCAIKGRLRDGHLAHRVLFHARPRDAHASEFGKSRCRFIAGCTYPFNMVALRKTVMNIGGMFCKKYSDLA